MAGRNMLMEQAPMHQQPSLGGRGAPGPNDPATAVMEGARSLGYQGNDLEEAMQMLWQAEPTDGVGEMIDAASQATGARPPWAGQQEQQPQQQPQMRRGY